jgi:ATP-dependent Clp protease, protease subunit
MTEEKNNDLISVEDRINVGLLENSIHFLNGDIVEDNSLAVIKWIIYENLKNDNQVLTLYINSDGGNLPDAFALIEVMNKSLRPIRTIGIGSVCSAAFLIFAAGKKGERFIGNTASIMCHQFSESSEGKYHDLQTKIKENKRMNDRMIYLLVNSSTLSEKEVKTKLLPPSDVWLSAEELIELGIADHIF